ncbi:MAG: PEP-utilizing enzyme [Gaiellaceae bacterium]
MTTWLPDPSHYPEQMTPLSATVWFEALGAGLHAAMRELRGSFGGFATRTENGWAYEAELQPDWPHDERHVRTAALGLGAVWEQELRPRVHAITAELEALRPERVDPQQAVAMVDRLTELVGEQWTLHFRVVIPAQLAAELFRDAYVELLGDGDPLAPYRLLEGGENPADAAVWELARSARGLGIDDLLRELAPEHALTRLRGLGPGRRWLQELGAYLLRFGGRARWHELSLPREAEFPALTLEGVRLLLESGVQRVEPTRGDPPPKLAKLFEQVRPAYALKELHTYDVDYPGLLATREALLGFGRRLAAEGLLDAVDDVWMVTRDELRAALVGAPGVPLQELVAARRGGLTEGLRDGPRAYLGDPPADAERHAALEKFYGSGGRALAGAGASPGVVEGVARIMSGPDDFGRVQPGDVLVATTTTPAWTPLFPSLGGLVTDTGGILSHAAIVAREYRIPAVVGAAGATGSIPDGARIRINGTTGEIRVV